MPVIGSIVVAVACLGGPGSAPAEAIHIEDAFVTLSAQVEVASREAGLLVEVKVREGDAVRQGQLLARVDDARPRLERDRATAELEEARRLATNQLKVRLAEETQQVALAELKRAEDSARRIPKSVSQAELYRLRLVVSKGALEIEQAKFELESARFAARVAEHAVRRAEHEIGRRKIVAPMAGTVVRLERQPGEWVEAGQTVLRLVRLDRLRVEGLLDAQAAGAPLAGRNVVIEVRLGEGGVKRFQGRVVFVSPEIHPVNGKVLLWAEVDNPDLLLRPGLRANMSIASETP